MDPSSIEMLINAPEAALRHFWVLLLFPRGPGHNSVLRDWSISKGSWGVRGVQINDHGFRDVIIFLVLYKDHKGLTLTTYDPSKPNTGLWTEHPWTLNNLSTFRTSLSIRTLHNGKQIFCTIRTTQNYNLTFSEPLITISIILGPIRIPQHPLVKITAHWEP